MDLLSRRALLSGAAALAATFGLSAPRSAAWSQSNDIQWPASLPRRILDFPEVRAAARDFVDGHWRCSLATGEAGRCSVVAGWVLSDADLLAIGRTLRNRRHA